MKLFGYPIFGFFLPFIGFTNLAANGDGGLVDTGVDDIRDERGPYFFRVLAIEWLGVGLPFPIKYALRDSKTGLPVS